MSEKQTRITGESERNITFTFDVNEILGRGGFGVVFRGTWGNGVEVQLAAVKRISGVYKSPYKYLIYNEI